MEPTHLCVIYNRDCHPFRFKYLYFFLFLDDDLNNDSSGEDDDDDDEPVNLSINNEVMNYCNSSDFKSNLGLLLLYYI